MEKPLSSSSPLSLPPFSRPPGSFIEETTYIIPTTCYQEGIWVTVSNFHSGVIMLIHSFIQQTSLSVCWVMGNRVKLDPPGCCPPEPHSVTAGGEPLGEGCDKGALSAL